MNDIECPYCEHGHNSGDYPDHGRDGRRFEFTCEACGEVFDVDVDWEPVFSTFKRAAK